MSSISGSGRFLGGRQGNPLWYSCLEDPIDKGAWRAAVPGVTKSLRTWLKWLGTQMSARISRMKFSVWRKDVKCLWFQVRGSKTYNPNTPLWHTDYFELIIFKKQQMKVKLCKLSRSYPFQEIFIFIKKISIYKSVFLFVLVRECWLWICRNSSMHQAMIYIPITTLLCLLCFSW